MTNTRIRTEQIRPSYDFFDGVARFGNVTGSFAKFEEDGTIYFTGSATVWDDLRVPVSSIARLGFSDPDWEEFKTSVTGSVGVYALAFGKTVVEEVFFSCQIPHSWKIGSNLNPHIHWSPSDTDTGDVMWVLEYTISEIGGIFGDTEIISVVDAGDGVAHKHQYADLGDIDMSAYTSASDVSIMLMCRLYRNGIAPQDTYDNDAFLLEIDFHFQIDMLGSREEASK